MVVLDAPEHLLLVRYPFSVLSLGIFPAIFFPVAVLSLLGIVGNVMSLIVWTRPQLKSSSTILLIALAASDLVTVLIILSTATLSIILYHFIGLDFDYSPTYWKLRYCIVPYVEFWVPAVFNIAQTSARYLTLAITLERYIAVCHPFQFQIICTYSRACKSAASIIIFSILYNLCRFWERRFEHADLMDDGLYAKSLLGIKRLYLTSETEFRKNPLHLSVYRIWLYLTINYLLPLAGIVILNTAVCLKLKIVNRERQTLTDLQKKENRLTRMLICVVVEFLVCTSMAGFSAIWSSFETGDRFYLFGLDVSHSIAILSTFFDTFNSSVNFVTYVIFRGPFRKTFVKMFCFCCCKESAQPMQPASPRKKNRTSDKEGTPV